jgi:hypothetical protein
MRVGSVQARISIGLCHVDSDCPYTDAEIRLRANLAKKEAKTRGGKDCIVACCPDKHTELKIVKPDERAEK